VVFATETLAAGIKMPARNHGDARPSRSEPQRGHRPLMGQ